MKDRFSPVSRPKFFCCNPPFSFYKFIEKYSSKKPFNRTLHRIFSLMRKMHAQTISVENLARKGELAKERKAIEIRCKGNVKFQAWRFSFFTCPITKDLLPYVNSSEYLGYVIFIKVKLPNSDYCHYVYESVIATPSLHSDCSLPTHYIHCVRQYTGWVADKHLMILGSFFSQQNSLTHVCAHAALRWILNNIPERVEKIVTYEEINKNLGINHKSRQVGQYLPEDKGRGLSISDLTKVIEKNGYKQIIGDFENTTGNPQPYWKFIYSILESGFPVLVLFTASNARHVICVIGHTLNTDIWDSEAKLAYSDIPETKYLTAPSWVDHFIIHDDNYGMYFCMPIKALSPPTHPLHAFQVTGAIGIVPTQVELDPNKAELYACIVLRFLYNAPFLKDCYWLKTLVKEDRIAGKSVVLRTFLTNKTAYEQHLQNMEDSSNNILEKAKLQLILNGLPEYFWMTEFSLADIYTANKHKLGEILFQTSKVKDKESTAGIFSKCLMMRLPGNIIVPTATKTEISVTPHKTSLIGHVPLLRTCRTSPKFEW